MPRKSKEGPHSLPSLTEREVVYSYDQARSRPVFGQPAKRAMHLVLGQAGVNRPTTVEITRTSSAPRLFSATVERQTRDNPNDRFHINFAPDKQHQLQAIVTHIGQPGEPLVPAVNPTEKLTYTQNILDQHLESTVRNKSA